MSFHVFAGLEAEGDIVLWHAKMNQGNKWFPETCGLSLRGMVFVVILIALLMVKDVLWSNGMLLVPIGDFMVLIVFDNEISKSYPAMRN